MDKDKIEEYVFKFIFLLCICTFVYFICKIFWKPMLPFILAWIVSYPIRTLSQKISAKIKIPRKIATIIIVLSTIVFAVLFIRFAGGYVVSQVSNLAEKFSENPEWINESLNMAVEKIKSFGGIFSRISEIFDDSELSIVFQKLEDAVGNSASYTVEKIYSKLSAFVLSVISGLPSFFMACVMFVIACFYFSCDGGEIKENIFSFLPEKIIKKTEYAKTVTKRILKGYFGASFLLCLLTFLIAFIGLAVIGYEYAFIVAVLIAIVDFLPVFGAGTVMIPWACVSFLCSNTKFGMAILILYAIITIIRQISEPKIIGKNIGLGAVATLILVYVGMKIFGFAGIFIAPFVGAVAKEILLSIKGKSAE